MARYQQPRRINIVSLILLLAVGGGIYATVQFGPAYWRMWQVKEILSDTASRFMSNPTLAKGDGRYLSDIRDQAADRVRALVRDTKATVSLALEGGEVKVAASYAEVVKHPYVAKITVLRFNPSVVRHF
jgi:hypothetical protein